MARLRLHPQSEDRSAAAGEWAVLKTTSVQWDHFDPFANKALGPGLTPRPDSAVKAGDVLVTRAGRAVGRFGVACVVLEDQPFRMLSRQDSALGLRRQACLPTMWLSCACTEGPGVLPTGGETGLAASQANLSRSRLLGVGIPHLSLERHRIVQ